MDRHELTGQQRNARLQRVVVEDRPARRINPLGTDRKLKVDWDRSMLVGHEWMGSLGRSAARQR